MKMKIINVDQENFKNDLKGKIKNITKSQLTQIFDTKQDKELINSLKYIESNKIESYNDKYLGKTKIIHIDINIAIVLPSNANETLRTTFLT